MENVELKLVGITFNQIESGVYALILEAIVSKKRLAIVIGYPEAQSIECHLQNIKTPRPLSHDLMANIITGLNSRLKYVYIHKLITGPYAADLHITDEIGREIVIDSRSSDAIALAIRLNAPIYASTELLENEGYLPDREGAAKSKRVKLTNTPATKSVKHSNDIANMSDIMLKEYIDKCVASEKYEEAALAKKEMERRGLMPGINND